MAATIYLLCAATCLVCALLLLRGWLQTRGGLLLWSGLCFVGLTASNVLLVLDRIVWPEPEVDFTTARLALALVGILLLVFGLIWESD